MTTQTLILTLNYRGKITRGLNHRGEISGEITEEEITGGDNRVEITEGNHRGNHLLLFKL